MKLTLTALSLLILLFACKLCSLTGGDTKRFDPYQGSLNDLLPKEMSIPGTSGKLEQQSISVVKIDNAKDAVRAQYKYSGAGFYVIIDCLLVNYEHSGNAGAALTEAALRDHPTDLGDKMKNGHTVGGRYTANGGKMIIWTDGSLVCQISSTIAKPLENFEAALPF